MESHRHTEVVTVQRESSGEQRLCMAVIIQAVKDIHYSKKKRESLGGKLPQRADKDAVNWILSNSTAPFSFLWCLEHAFPELYDELDISEIRRIVLSKPLLCNSVTLYHSGLGSGRKPLSLYIK